MRLQPITFGTGVLPLAKYHPAMAAAQAAMVDHLLQGRFVLGFGPGVSGDAEAIGDPGSDRNRKTQEALDHMCRIWSEEPPYRIEGEFYRTTTERSLDRNIGVGVAVRPLQRPHPPIAITSIRPDARGPHAAGARGWTGISATYLGAYVVRAQIQNYLEGRRSAGLSVDPSGWRPFPGTAMVGQAFSKVSRSLKARLTLPLLARVSNRTRVS